MNNKEILELLYIKKDYSEVKELLKNSDDIRSFNILGKINLWAGNIEEAYKNFNKAQSIIGCCYCHFFNEELEEAKILTKLVNDSSPAIRWLSGLIDLINDEKEINLSYFEIRNFYEQDLELLFKYQKSNYINKITEKLTILEYFNREIYKYTGRVFYNNSINNIAQELLKKSLDIFYNDPETHFLLGEIYLLQGKKDMAIKEFQTSSDVNNGYLPATNKLKDLMIV